MRIAVHSTLADLQADLTDIAVKAQPEMRNVVREGLKVGNTVAKDNAKRSSGRHGKLYPRSFTTEMHGGLSAITGGGLISGEYGPDSARPQGGMSFEFGSRKQKPHLDLARSADVVGPALAREVGDLVDRLFW